MIEMCEKYAKLHDVLFNGPKSKILVYNEDADPHFEINGTDVSICEKYIWEMYLAQQISTKWYLMVSRNLIVVLIDLCLSLVHFKLS